MIKDRFLLLAFIRFGGYIFSMEQTALIFQSLSEEIRLRILSLLMGTEELCVCDFMAVLQLPQSTVSRHLAHLKNAGWLLDRREGVWIYYRMAPSLPTLQQSLLPVLDIFLKTQAVAVADRQRLIACQKNVNCA